MTELSFSQIYSYLELHCPSDQIHSRLVEFTTAGDCQEQYDECVRKNYNLVVFDDWMHLQNILGVKLDYVPAMKIRRILAESNISIATLQKTQKNDDVELHFILPQELQSVYRTVEIYRLKKNFTETANMMLMSFAYMLAHSFSVDSSKYDLIYSGPMYYDENLEDVHCRLHTSPPIDLPGHSINKSDVIVIHEAGNRTAYFVDTYSFEALPNFFENSAENP